jgi:hypothetical protein
MFKQDHGFVHMMWVGVESALRLPDSSSQSIPTSTSVRDMWQRLTAYLPVNSLPRSNTPTADLILEGSLRSA